MYSEWEPEPVMLILSHSSALQWQGPDLEEIAWSKAVLHKDDVSTTKLLGELRERVAEVTPFTHAPWRGTERKYDCCGVLAYKQSGTLVVSTGVPHRGRESSPVKAVVINDLLWVIPQGNFVLELAVHLRVREWLCKRGYHSVEDDPHFWVFDSKSAGVDIYSGVF
jgi:hypothetical protein